MNKKDIERIRQIFSDRKKSLIECAGHLGFEKMYDEMSEEMYETEMQKIDDTLNLLFYLEQQIIEG